MYKRQILLTILGQKLNVDIYLAAIVVFVWRMFMNLGTIRTVWNKEEEKYYISIVDIAVSYTHLDVYKRQSSNYLKHFKETI